MVDESVSGDPLCRELNASAISQDGKGISGHHLAGIQACLAPGFRSDHHASPISLTLISRLALCTVCPLRLFEMSRKVGARIASST